MLHRVAVGDLPHAGQITIESCRDEPLHTRMAQLLEIARQKIGVAPRDFYRKNDTMYLLRLDDGQPAMIDAILTGVPFKHEPEQAKPKKKAKRKKRKKE